MDTDNTEITYLTRVKDKNSKDHFKLVKKIIYFIGTNYKYF